MPDELAGRATLLLIGGIVLGTALGFAVSALWQRRPGRPSGSLPGIAAGLALFAAAMAWVALDMAAVVASRRDYIELPGTVLGFDAVKLRESRGGRRLQGNAPVVEFTFTDGQRHELRGLAGSLQRREPGATVRVRVNPADPRQAVVADFQNQYAALYLFGSFAGLAGLGALFSAVMAAQVAPGAGSTQRVAGQRPARHKRQASQAAHPAPTQGFRASPQGRHWQALFQRAAWLTGALSLLALFAMAQWLHLGRAIAASLAGLTTALVCGAVAAMLKPAAPVWTTLLGRSIGVLASGLFATFVWLLSGP